MGKLRRFVWLAAIVAFGSAASIAAAQTAESAAPSGGVQQRAGRPARFADVQVSGLLSESPPSVYLVEPEESALHDTLRAIGLARRDPALTGLIVRVGQVEAGWAKVQEIRRALSLCRKDGKQVICILEGTGNLEYYLATAADRIVLPPAGHLMLGGLRAEAVFLKGLLDKIGVKAEVVQAGQYKTAGEALTRTEPSQAFRESVGSVLEDYYRQLLEGIAEGRHMTGARAAALLREGPFTARQAREVGLVDDVLFYDELLSDLEGRLGGPVEVDAEYGRKRRPQPFAGGPMGLLSMLMGAEARGPRRTAGPAVAVLYAVGPIIREEPNGISLAGEVVSSRSFVRVIRNVADDGNVKAVVLRVDSPGGSAAACDDIWRELRLADRRKPVIASLSDVAASGGYYIAAGARAVYADPGSLTGSIGVFGGKLVLTGLLEKIGVNVAVMERGGHAGIESPFSEFTPHERRKVEELVAQTYRTFLARVAETRPKMSVADVDRVGQGRIWTASQAHKNGLVDTMGGLEEAIEAARAAAGIPPEQAVEILHLPRPRSFIEVLLFGEEETAELPAPWGAVRGAAGLSEARLYVGALLCMQGEVPVCMLPALIRFR